MPTLLKVSVSSLFNLLIVYITVVQLYNNSLCKSLDDKTWSTGVTSGIVWMIKRGLSVGHQKLFNFHLPLKKI